MKIKRVEHIAMAANCMKRPLDLMRDPIGPELEYIFLTLATAGNVVIELAQPPAGY